MSSVTRAYRQALNYTFRNWKLLLLMYSMNLLLTLLVLTPLKAILTSLLENTRAAENLATQFDFNLFMDLFHQHPEFLGGYMNYVIMGLIIYFLWINFYKGGILGLFRSGELELSKFFSSAAKYFWKNLRISIYTILFYVLVVIVMYSYFAKDGLHVFDLESEVFLIDRFYFLAGVLFVLVFLSSIWTVLVRIQILYSNKRFLWQDMIRALKTFYRLPFISMAALNLVLLTLLAFAQLSILQSDVLEKSSVSLILIVQLVVILRMVLLITRLGSFYKLSESEN